MPFKNNNRAKFKIIIAFITSFQSDLKIRSYNHSASIFISI